MITRYAEIPAYDTKDGSKIRELMHPDQNGNHAQSLAEAVVAPGQETHLHRHGRTEEIYHITRGEGLMRLGDETFSVSVGDTVCIAPGTPHNIRNTGSQPLHILCACSPAYRHGDTELLSG